MFSRFYPCHNYYSLVAIVVSDSCNPIDCSLPGSSVHGILQARILEWVAISFSRGSSRPRNQTLVSYLAGRFFYQLSCREACYSLEERQIGKSHIAGEDSSMFVAFFWLQDSAFFHQDLSPALFKLMYTEFGRHSQPETFPWGSMQWIVAYLSWERASFVYFQKSGRNR